MSKIGEQIRKLRKAKKVTLVELAEKTGVAQATLSRIETGIMIGTVESHQKIAETLGVTLAGLYSGVDTRAEKVDYQKVDARKPKKLGKGIIEILTTSTAKKKMLPVLIKLDKSSEVSFTSEEVGIEKFIYCLKGEIELKLGTDSYTLKPQESLYFDASLAHSLKNTSTKPAECFGVTSPPRI